MNQMLSAAHVYRLVSRWFPSDGPPVKLSMSDEPGYDIQQDLAWEMRLRIQHLGRDLTCYISALDLTMHPEELSKMLLDGWRRAFFA